MWEDWVKNRKTGKYEWNDNVTSPENTPIGYRYIDAKDKDILRDLNLPDKFSTKSTTRTSAGLQGEEGKGGVPVGAQNIYIGKPY